MKKLTLLILLWACFGCGDKPKVSVVTVRLIDKQQSLKITGINYLILKEIASDTSSHWKSLFPVYRMPKDTDLKDYQPEQPGKYQLKDSTLVYTPDTPFTKQQTYFVRYYQFGDNNNVWDFAQGKKRPGKTRFTDLIFKQ